MSLFLVKCVQFMSLEPLNLSRSILHFHSGLEKDHWEAEIVSWWSHIRFLISLGKQASSPTSGCFLEDFKNQSLRWYESYCLRAVGLVRLLIFKLSSECRHGSLPAQFQYTQLYFYQFNINWALTHISFGKKGFHCLKICLKKENRTRIPPLFFWFSSGLTLHANK